MADQPHIQNIEQPHLEADINRLSSEIKKHYEQHPEAAKLSGQEIIKKSLQAAYPQPVQPKAASAGTQVLETESILPDYAKAAPEEIKIKIEKLVEMTFREGLEKATNEAKKEDPFILDAFHDSLVEKLYPILKQRGIIK